MDNEYDPIDEEFDEIERQIKMEMEYKRQIEQEKKEKRLAEARKKQRRIGIIVAICLLALLQGLLVFAWTRPSRKPSSRPNPTNSAQITPTNTQGNPTVKPSDELVLNSTEATPSMGSTEYRPLEIPGGIVYPEGSPVAEHGLLSLNGVTLVDMRGTPIQLKGVSTHGVAWYSNFISENSFQTLRDDWGVNLVRLAMYTAEHGGYCTGGNQTELKETVCKGVDAATALGMYAIIDWHVLNDNNPKKYQKEALAFFDEMSKKYKNNVNVIYEICNEPCGGTTWADIKTYAEAVIPVIKANSPEAVIIVGTSNWSQDVHIAAQEPIHGYSNIMYSMHFYASTHRDWLRNRLVDAIRVGLPVFISEFGICDASGNGLINEEQANQWMAVMNQYNISYSIWNLSNKSETSSLIRSDCQKEFGWTEDDLSDSGKWFVDMLHGIKKEKEEETLPDAS